MNSKFSILINVYNGAEFISQTLQSVLHQTFSDFEILIYDNCSTDCTINKLDKFDDRRIQLFRGNETIVLPLARQYLLDRARGEYCIFLDADDLWLPNFLEMIETSISKKDGICFLYSNFCVMDRDNNSLKIKNGTSAVNTTPPGKLLSKYNVGFFCFCFSRSLITESNIRFDPDINAGCDYAFVLEINSKFSGLELPFILGVNRWHNNNLSQTDPSKNSRELAAWHFKHATKGFLGFSLPHLIQGSRFQFYSILKATSYHGFWQYRSFITLLLLPILTLIKLRRFCVAGFKRIFSVCHNLYLYLSYYQIFFLNFENASIAKTNTSYSCHRISDLHDIWIVKLVYLMIKNSVFNPKDFCGSDAFVTLRCANEEIAGAAFFSLNVPYSLSIWLQVFFRTPGLRRDECVLFSSSCSVQKLSGVSDAIARIEKKMSVARALGKKSAITISNVDVKNAKFFFERLGFERVFPRLRKKL